MSLPLATPTLPARTRDIILPLNRNMASCFIFVFQSFVTFIVDTEVGGAGTDIFYKLSTTVMIR